MQAKLPWYRNNRNLAVFLPFLVIIAAYAQISFDGTARLVAQVVAGLLLVGFIVLVTFNVRARAR